MSTKRRKIYNKQDIKIAQEETKKKNRYFTRLTQRRKTVQVRISEKNYKQLKEIARSEKSMISFTLDHICEHYFKHCDNLIT
jgi:hypothetical protein